MDDDETIYEPYDEDEDICNQSIGVLVTEGKEYAVRPGETLKIGRSEHCHVCLNDKTVSREHAVLEVDNSGHFLTDYKSRCGTFRGSVRLTPARTYEISDGAILRFGPHCVAKYKILPNIDQKSDNLGDAELKQTEQGPESLSDSKLMSVVLDVVPLPSPPPQYHVGIRQSLGGDDQPLYLEPTQSDINSSIASLQGRGIFRQPSHPVPKQTASQLATSAKNAVANDMANSSDLSSPKLVIAMNDDDGDDPENATVGDLDDTVSDTVSTTSITGDILESIAADLEEDKICAPEHLEKNLQSADNESDLNLKQPLFSMPPQGADSGSPPTLVHWQCADIVASTTDMTAALSVNEDTRETAKAESKASASSPQDDEEAVVKRGGKKAAVPRRTRKVKEIEPSAEEDTKIQPVKNTKPGRKSQAPAATKDLTAPVNQADLSHLGIVSPPTAAAASALLDLKNPAEKVEKAVEKAETNGKKAAGRKSTRRDVASDKQIGDLTTSMDEDIVKPTARAKRAKTVVDSDEAVTPAPPDLPEPKTPKSAGNEVSEASSRTTSRAGTASAASARPTTARKTMARRSTIAARDAKILITGEKDDSTIGHINQLGANQADSLSDCTHLVVGGPARRTVKLVACIGHGIPVASVEWLKASVAAKCLLEPDDYRPEGIEALEVSQNFSLSATLESARKKRLLDGFSVYAVPKLSKLKEDEIKAMIKSAGGRCLTRPPKTFSENTVVIVGDGAVPAGSDQQAAATVSIPPDISCFAELGLPMVSSEFLLAGILRYDANPAHFPVEIPVSYGNAKTDGAKDSDVVAAPKGKPRRATVAVAKITDENEDEAIEKMPTTATAKKASAKSGRKTVVKTDNC